MNNKQSKFNWQLYLGLVLVLTGGIFLADLFMPFNLMRFFWPLLIVLFGLTFIVGMVIAGRGGSGLAIPGAIISTLGLLLFVQNTFHLWVTWTYAWALLISAVGLGLLLMNIYHKRMGLRLAGGLIIGIGLTLFVVFGVFFEVILNISGTDLYSGMFLGVGLVLLGLFVVFSRPLFVRGKKQQSVTPESEAEVITVAGEVSETPDTVAEETYETETGTVLVEGKEFDRLLFKSVGEVILTQGDSCSVEIKGNPDLVEKVKANVRDSELSITYDAKIKDWGDLNWLEGPNLRYYVTMKSVNAIKMAGAGNLEAGRVEAGVLSLIHSGLGKLSINELTCQALTVELGGLGEIMLKGTVQSQEVDLTGAGSYEAVNLECRTARVTISGAGSAKVWVEKALEANVSGAGNILYKGNAEVTKNSTGLGDVKSL